MRFAKPSPAMVVAITAVVLASAGTAFAATGQLVNIVDPGNATQAARVDSAGKLSVGDGSGPFSVDGTTTSREAPPSALVRGRAIAGPPGTCVEVLPAPAGKALLIKTLHIDTYSNPTPNQGNFVGIYAGAGCSSLVMFANPATLGLTSIPLEPGATVPAGQSLTARSGGNLGTEVYATGYTVPASSVPAATAPAKATDVAPRPGG